MRVRWLPLLLAVTLVPLGLRALAAPASPEPGQGSAAVATAVFAGGCFWCMEPPFEALEGVRSVVSGYTGGQKESPTYEEVSSGATGHAESVQVTFDPQKVSYEKLLEVYWHNIDPLDAQGQFCDKGNQYRTAIFYRDDAQKAAAEKSKADIDRSGRLKAPIVTQIVAASTFYPAEDYHQDYSKKNPVRYKFYRYGCGRDHRLEQLWGAEAGGGPH